MRHVLLAALALPCLAASAGAADYDARVAPARTLTVTRVASQDCPLYPVIVAPGRRGMGEPGSYYARWDLRPVCAVMPPPGLAR